MKMNISILGCGWLGIPLGKYLVSAGYIVKGSTRTLNKLTVLESAGIQPFLLDIANLDGPIDEFLSCDALIIDITSKNVEDYKTLIGKIKKSDIHKVLFVSATSVYPNTNDEVRETVNTIDNPLAAIENLFISNSAFTSTILRFGGLMGYDRQPGNFFRPGRIIDNPEGYVNFIHRDDCITIIHEIIKQEAWGEVFNACADSHPTRRAFYTQEALKLGKKIPTFNEDANNDYKIICSDKLKSHLNYTFKYADLMK